MGHTHLNSFAEERSFCRTFYNNLDNRGYQLPQKWVLHIWTVGPPGILRCLFSVSFRFFNSKRSEASKLQPKMLFSLNRKFSKASKSIKLFNKRATWYQRQLSILKSCHPGHDIPHKYTIMHICTWLKAWIPCLEYVD